MASASGWGGERFSTIPSRETSMTTSLTAGPWANTATAAAKAIDVKRMGCPLLSSGLQIF
jgi:hypothetical protein